MLSNLRENLEKFGLVHGAVTKRSGEVLDPNNGEYQIVNNIASLNGSSSTIDYIVDIYVGYKLSGNVVNDKILYNQLMDSTLSDIAKIVLSSTYGSDGLVSNISSKLMLNDSLEVIILSYSVIVNMEFNLCS